MFNVSNFWHPSTFSNWQNQTSDRYETSFLLNLFNNDLNNSFDNIKDAIHFYKISKKVFSNGDFILHKWATNCDQLSDFVNTQSHPSDV